MEEKKYLYGWQKKDFEDLSYIEVEAFKKANELNDKLLDIKIMLDEFNYDWDEYMDFLEDKHISKIWNFRGFERIDFDEELLQAITATLRKSLNDSQKSLNYNSKKIALNRVIEG